MYRVLSPPLDPEELMAGCKNLDLDRGISPPGEEKEIEQGAHDRVENTRIMAWVMPRLARVTPSSPNSDVIFSDDLGSSIQILGTGRPTAASSGG